MTHLTFKWKMMACLWWSTVNGVSSRCFGTRTHRRRMFRRCYCTFSSFASVCVCVSSYMHMFFEWMSCSIHPPELFHFLPITELKKKNTSGQEISFSCFYPTSFSLSLSFFVTVSFSPSEPSTKFSDGVAWIFDLVTPKGNRSRDGDESQTASVSEREIWWKCEWAALTGYVWTSTVQADK